MAGWSVTFIAGKIKPAQSAPLTALITQCFMSSFCPLLYLHRSVSVTWTMVMSAPISKQNLFTCKCCTISLFPTRTKHKATITKFSSERVCVSLSASRRKRVCVTRPHIFYQFHMFAFGVSHNREKQIISAIFLRKMCARAHDWQQQSMR